MNERQLAFDLAPTPSYAREDFLAAPSNARALSLIQAWPNWPDGVLALIGPAGAGKSHLASIWAARCGAARVEAIGLPPRAGARLLREGAVLVENADRPGVNEPELFHLLNRARAEGAFVVLTARTPVAAWPIALRDLRSRLRQAPSVALGQPDDELMRAVLLKLFVDRQLDVDMGIVEYLAVRLDRSFEAARRAVELLDREALARSRPVTRALAGEVLALVGGAVGPTDPRREAGHGPAPC